MKKNILKVPYDIEHLKLSKNSIKAKINVLTGKEDTIWVMYCNALNVSGYGDTKQEAKESFDLNIGLFCENVLSVNHETQKKYLTELGWEAKKYMSKQFSKAYVNEKGQLQGLTDYSLQGLETFV